MRVVFAPDSYKEALGAPVVARALAEGWRLADPDVEAVLAPMADGGEGTVEAVVSAAGGSYVSATVTGPMGTRVQARYGLTQDGATAVIEMAEASGLQLVPAQQRDPRAATTRGTGELILHALERGARRILIGIGGSATNDGGAGMAQALGYRLLDAQGNELPPGGAALARLAQIDDHAVHPALRECVISVACDVTNPLCGAEGASAVFGPQKGASPEMVQELDAALNHYGRLLEQFSGRSILEAAGSGAAGGLGAGLLAFTNAQLCPGAALVAELIGLEQLLQGAALVVTGEGRIDSQTLQGKVPAGVAKLARKAGVPVVLVGGAVSEGLEELYEQGICGIFSISPGPMSLEQAVACTETSLRAMGRALGGLWRA